MIAALLAMLASIPTASLAWKWLPDATHLFLFGVCAAIVLFLHFDKILLGKMRGGSVWRGLLFGGVAGALASLLATGLRLGVANVSPWMYRISVWALCISLIGLGIGMRWFKVNRARALHVYAGALAGGLLGGLLFTFFSPHVPAGMSLAGLILAGAGTGFGAGIAPVMVRDGVLRFISSGDARAQNKLGNNNTLWELVVDESYVLGNASTSQSGTRFQQGADICVPDASMALRHAVIFSRDGRFFLARHPDAAGSEGIAKYVLRVKGKTVVGSQELHPADDLLIGRTALRFESRRRGE